LLTRAAQLRAGLDLFECYSESETRGNGGMGHRAIILTCRDEAWRRRVLILVFVSTIQLFNVSTHPNDLPLRVIYLIYRFGG
jgi:hypothetical protein